MAMPSSRSAILLGRAKNSVFGVEDANRVTERRRSQALADMQVLKRSISQSYSVSREPYARAKGKGTANSNVSSNAEEESESSPVSCATAVRDRPIVERQSDPRGVPRGVRVCQPLRKTIMIRDRTETNGRLVRQCHLCGVLFKTSHCCGPLR